MKPFLSSVCFVALALTLGCKESSMNSYQQSEVNIFNIVATDSSVKLYFSTPSESIFYCPGANLSQDVNGIYIDFKRCSIHDECVVTNTVHKDSNGEYIIAENNGKSIYLQGGEEQKLIFSVN